MARYLKLSKDIAAAAGITTHEADRVVTSLQRDDAMMAELMAVCARLGPALNDSDWEWCEPSEPNIRAGWYHGGSKLEATHYLPEPNKP